MTDPTYVPVAVACRCPGAPHDGDTVYLRPRISLTGGVLAQQAVYESDPTLGAVAAGLFDAFLRHEIVDWTFTNEQNEALPVTPENIERLILSDFTYAKPIADRASELYTEAVISPLVVEASTSSADTPTNGSTSPQMASSSKRPKRPKRSSTPGTQTDDTAAIST